MLYFSFFFSVTLLVYGISTLGHDRRQMVKKRLSLLGEKGIEETLPEEEPVALKGPGPIRRLLRLLWKLVKRRFSRNMSEAAESRMEIKLLRAGRPFGMGPVEFRIVQMCLFTAVPALCIFYTVLLGSGPGGYLLAAAIGVAAGMILPHYYISIKAKSRAKTALKELPDTLDLLTVSLEAGLGFDAALSKLVAKSDGVLSAEFQRCLEEIRLGRTRREALLGVKERVALEEIRVLVSSILQAEKLGIGMVQVLRVQSQEVREQRKQRAEEEAMKAPIKMLFPLVLFIFPSLFIVVLGPAVIQFIEAFAE